MRELLIEGRKSANGSYYIHVGDLDWWLFYPPAAHEWQEILFLWDHPDAQVGLRGWALLSPEWRAFDAFVHPRERGSQQAAGMYTWAEERLAEIVRAGGGQEIRSMWVLEGDTLLAAHLEGRGFARQEEHLVYHERSLESPIPDLALPQGYRVRPVAGESELALRAAASHAAFESKLPFEAYCQRYQRFMRSPVYDPARDLVVIGPDGSAAAFCVFWLDPANRVGLFEPVGTHPAYRQQGLGKAVLLEGLRRMGACGMRTAAVCAESDNPAALALYRSVGFQAADRIRTYSKRL
jgi:ribosomal protein S18 acetylase RimI-like enzyme